MGADKEQHFGGNGIQREYNQNKKDWVMINVQLPSATFKPNQADCVKYLSDMILDNCDSSNNPGNPKGGGTVQVGPCTLGPQAHVHAQHTMGRK